MAENFFRLRTLLVGMLVSSALLSSARAEEPATDAPPPEPVTTQNPSIPIDELELLVKPLTKDELLVEADAWLELLKAKTDEVSRAEIAVKQKNKIIDKAEEVKKEIDKAKDTLDEVKKASEATKLEGATDTAEQASVQARKAEEAVRATAATIEEVAVTTQQVEQDENVQKTLRKTEKEPSSEETASALEDVVESSRRAQKAAADVTEAAEDTAATAKQGREEATAVKAEAAAAAVDEATEALTDTSEAITDATSKSSEEAVDTIATEQLDKTVEAAETISERQKDVKSEILDVVTRLREERTALADRLNVVLDELNLKLGKTPEGKDNEVVVPYRLYGAAVSGIQVDVSDTQATWATLAGWVKSDEGGIRWLQNFVVFVVTIIAFWILGLILGKMAEKAFSLTKSSAVLLRNFIVHSVRRVTIFIGIIIGLAALEINIGPLLALIGAAGFVVAFALQNTLSNFASGIMIMLYRPFDVGDVIDVANIIGVVKSMSLVTTTITTGDNQIMVVPNNSIWGNIITNITGSEERRVDMVFSIGYDDDIGNAMRVLEEIVNEHPLVLKEPAPTIQVNELAESSVNIICRPWTKTLDYWELYWDLIRTVKERFDKEGISIPFPQREVHLSMTSGQNPNPLSTDLPKQTGGS
jgi:small conductance mechanosensitive channel